MQILLSIEKQYQFVSNNKHTKQDMFLTQQLAVFIKKQSQIMLNNICIILGAISLTQVLHCKWSQKIQPIERQSWYKGLRIGSSIVHSQLKYPQPQCILYATSDPCQYSSALSKLQSKNNCDILSAIIVPMIGCNRFFIIIINPIITITVSSIQPTRFPPLSCQIFYNEVSMSNINQEIIIMSASTVLAGIPVQKTGLNYLVPTPWWNEFCLLNKSISDPALFQIPLLNMVDYADRFLLDYKSDLIDELEAKSNYLKFNQIKISLEVQKNLGWTPINPVLWRIISKKNKDSNGIYTIIQEQKKYDLKSLTQVQIIFCSKNRSDAFVGYLPNKANLSFSMREIGFQMGFFEVVKSKVAFLDKNPQISFSFHQIQQYTIENAPGTCFMTFNMERKDQEQTVEKDLLDLIANESNEAVVGDLNTMEDDSNNHLFLPVNNRTMSTGAETPFSFALSEGFDLDREYRVKQLFGAKEPQEIEQMKQLAINRIQNEKQLINIPSGDENHFQNYLDKLAEQLLQGFLKKKICKQKEKEQIAFE